MRSMVEGAKRRALSPSRAPSTAFGGLPRRGGGIPGYLSDQPESAVQAMIIEDVDSREAKKPNALVRQPYIPPRIVTGARRKVMRRSVDFHCQP